jgi:hypothetical protein
LPLLRREMGPCCFFPQQRTQAAAALASFRCRIS